MKPSRLIAVFYISIFLLLASINATAQVLSNSTTPGIYKTIYEILVPIKNIKKVEMIND